MFARFENVRTPDRLLVVFEGMQQRKHLAKHGLLRDDSAICPRDKLVTATLLHDDSATAPRFRLAKKGLLRDDSVTTSRLDPSKQVKREHHSPHFTNQFHSRCTMFHSGYVVLMPIPF